MPLPNALGSNGRWFRLFERRDSTRRAGNSTGSARDSTEAARDKTDSAVESTDSALGSTGSAVDWTDSSLDLSYSARAATRAAVENCCPALDSRESQGRETR